MPRGERVERERGGGAHERLEGGVRRRPVVTPGEHEGDASAGLVLEFPHDEVPGAGARAPVHRAGSVARPVIADAEGVAAASGASDFLSGFHARRSRPDVRHRAELRPRGEDEHW
jgi:hypothetical protein